VTFVGLGFVILFIILMSLFWVRERKQLRPDLRAIQAFTKLKQGLHMSVEAGQRLHLSLGHGGVTSQTSTSSFIGLSLLQRIARAAMFSDRPPVTTSGEAAQAFLSQDTLHSAYRAVSVESQYDPDAAQITGLTPFSFAAGSLPVIYDQQVSVNIMTGSFGSEVALIADAAEQTNSISLGGSENLAAQAVMYAAVQEPLIGEEFYAAGAYVQAGPMHTASLRTQDVLRWLLIGLILAGAALKLVGVL
jgi:Domain of unknown function (DUF6754)